MNVDLIARCSKLMFLYAELNVKPKARYSKCVWFWMQSWTSFSQLDIQDVCFRMRSWLSSPKLDIQSVFYFECRAECWTHSSISKVGMVLNAELNIDPTNRNSTWMFSNAELKVEPIARYSKCVLFWMQSWMSISQLDIQDVCFRMQSWKSNP